MLDHDDLLPEEQAYPGIVQKLQMTYQIASEETQALARVHERLAQSSHSLPLLKPTEMENPPFITTASPASRLTRRRQSWLSHLNVLAAVLLIGLIVGSLLFTFSLINQSRADYSSTKSGSPPIIGSRIRMVLIPVNKGHTPSQPEMEVTRTILVARFSQFGFKESRVNIVKVKGQPGIQIELLGSMDDEQQLIVNTLLEVGRLEFWDTGPHGLLTQGTNFKSDAYTRYNPSNQPLFTNVDFNPHAFSVVQDPKIKTYNISFSMRGDAAKNFQRFTARAIGHALTVTLDGKVLVSAIINSEIAGSGTLPINFTQRQADALVALLTSSELPFELKQLT